jgi:hypothetical protein
MIAAALRAGITAAMVTGDEAYGLDPLLRAGAVPLVSWSRVAGFSCHDGPVLEL